MATFEPAVKINFWNVFNPCISQEIKSFIVNFLVL